MPTAIWPTAREYQEAIQNPHLSFDDPSLRASSPALDRLGMPTVTSGQFAYVFKLNPIGGVPSQAVRCFRGASPDRERRYTLLEQYLERVPTTFLTPFEYDSSGIRVRGQKWPTLVMEWIDGHTLDSFVGRVVANRLEMDYLADVWLKVLHSLRTSQIAHGDLQHGNVIVDTSRAVRLVDLDGMFVPTMEGQRATELGHRHYQHPRRSESHFGIDLDNFAGLVIYLSLVALRESPSLWSKYHDENLIFSRADFQSPDSSPVFRLVSSLTSECAHLTQVLAAACRDEPTACPSVLDIAGVKSQRLPIWMLSAPTREIPTASREVQSRRERADHHVQSVKPVSTPWWQQAQSSTSASPAPSMQLPWGAATTPSVVPPTPKAPRSFTATVLSHAVTYAFIGSLCFFVWMPVLLVVLRGVVPPEVDQFALAVAIFLSFCLLLGVRRTKADRHAAFTQSNIQSTVITPAPSVGTASTPMQASAHNRPSPLGTTLSAPTIPGAHRRSIATPSGSAGTVVVASSIRFTFHRPGCRWAQKISGRNRVSFGSASAARSAGYRACNVCSP